MAKVIHDLGMTMTGINNCSTTADLLSYTQSKSDISSSKYRAVLRVGSEDTSSNGDLDYDDDWDYHW